jgi:hypothetical protein
VSGRYQPATAPGTCAGPRCGGTFRAGAMIIVTRRGQTFCSPACEAAAERARHRSGRDSERPGRPADRETQQGRYLDAGPGAWDDC